MNDKINIRYEKGKEMMDILDPEATDHLKEIMKDIAPDMVDWVVEFAYGDVMSRPGLDLRTRELAIIAAICAMGGREKELKIHISKALHIGITKKEITEVLLQMAVYAGFPASINGLLAAKEVFN